jgi:DNA polymerase III subunit delta
MIYKSYIVEQKISNLEKNLFLFYGENLGLKNDFKNIIKLNNKDSEIVKFNQDEILKNENLFFNEISNISLFAKKKIYYIEQTNDKLLDIIKEVVPKIDTQKLFFFSEILDKKSKIRNYFEKSELCGAVACYPDNEISIKKKILDKLRGFDGLTTNNINLLIENCNLDRSKLDNELTKVLTYFQNKKLDNKKLEDLLDIKINNNFNNLKDEAFNGNKIKTNKLLSDTIIDPEMNIFYLSLINQRLSKLLQISIESKISNIDDAINKIKPPIFWKDKPSFTMQSKKWSSQKIKFALGKTYNLEVMFKSNSVINKNILMKKLIVDICKLANVA